MNGGRHDFAARRKTVRRGREKGCWLYVPAEVLESIGYPVDGPPPFSRCWPGRKHTVLVQSVRGEVMASLIERLGDSFTFDPDGCWRWQRHTVAGYAHIRGGRSRLAHRVMYELLVGPIPEGLHIDHLCRNPICVNPAHMEPVTVTENNRRTRKESCRKGHSFDAVNTYWHRGKRHCRACRRERHRLARAAA